MEEVIKLENVSKQYRLGTIGTKTLQGDLSRWWANVMGKEDPFLKVDTANQIDVAGGEFVWALKDVHLNVKQGDVLGIIGKNGAGKSTLLKILSRITLPTRGTIRIKGRTASLLEVGTGFHPELTGRENIFLNGAILGMTKIEIKNKFDEIVAFSGVEKFLDTPVKRYSSGMYVRLAFAVAAHLDPDILIVDEVLAVGDAAFQKKCLGKMKDSAGEGRTVLFVSHNIGAIAELTRKCALLEYGHIKNYGATPDVISNYLSEIRKQDTRPRCEFKLKDESLELKRFFFDKSFLRPGFNKPLRFVAEFVVRSGQKQIDVRIPILNSFGNRLMTMRKVITLEVGYSKVSFVCPEPYLPCGDYSVHLGIEAQGKNIFAEHDIVTFDIPSKGFNGAWEINLKDKLGVITPVEYTIDRE
jgi:lipopolysaccharide transport system ATP-binding protein